MRQLFIFFVCILSAVACDSPRKPTKHDIKPGRGDANLDQTEKDSPNRDAEPEPEIELNPSDSEDADHEAPHSIKKADPVTYSVQNIRDAGFKAVFRFRRMNLVGARVLEHKSWKTDTDIWTSLNYETPDASGVLIKKSLFLACHFHGVDLGCHTKSAAGPNEPETAAADDDVGGSF